jgi:hypothetical protein
MTDDTIVMKHTNIQTNEEVMRAGMGEDEHVGVVKVTGFDDDYETAATDDELEQIEKMARSRGVMHWAGLVRIINRLRRAEASRDRLRALLVAVNDQLVSEEIGEPAVHDWADLHAQIQAELGDDNRRHNHGGEGV